MAPEVPPGASRDVRRLAARNSHQLGERTGEDRVREPLDLTSFRDRRRTTGTTARPIFRIHGSAFDSCEPDGGAHDPKMSPSTTILPA
jgi:hypothetical protein